MEGVSILHRKLTHTDQSGSRTGLITEFCLDLIDHKRIFGVALCILAYKVYGCLLVGHAEYHFGIVAVGEAQQLIADAIVTAGLIPQRSRHDNRELHFLAVDFVHFLAQDLLDSRTISKRDMRRQVNLYMQTVMGEEPVRPDLVDFDDALTW